MSKIIGICGPSGSGKTTLAKLLADKLDADVISLDNYFLFDTPYKKYDDLEKDLELPENTDWDEINYLVSNLKKGDEVKVRKVSWENNNYTEYEFVPKNIVILEGFLLLHDDILLKKLDLSIYIDVPDEIGIERRLARVEKGEDIVKLRAWYETVTFPEYAARRDLFKSRADLVLNGEKSLEKNLEILSKEVKHKEL